MGQEHTVEQAASKVVDPFAMLVCPTEEEIKHQQKVLDKALKESIKPPFTAYFSPFLSLTMHIYIQKTAYGMERRVEKIKYDEKAKITVPIG